MKKFNLWKLLFSVFFACAAVAFVGCVDDNDDEGMPYLEVTPPQLAFDESGAPAAGSTGKFAVKTNRPWQLIVEEKDADWVRPSATEGKGSGEVSFNLPATVGGRSAKLTFQVINPYGPYITQEVTLTQGEVVPEQLVYNETFGTTGSNTQVAAYTGWDKTGEGASTVTYGGSGCDIRSNLVSTSFSNYAGSGGSNLMFGSGETSFIINDITLPADIDTYTLTFGASYYQAPNIEIFDQLTVAFSADGEVWTDAVPYAFDGFVAGNNWNLATINFTLAQHVDQLYIKFMSTKPAEGNYRIDDVKLVTSNGGEVINVGEPAALTVTPAALTLGNAAGATATLSVKAQAAWTATVSGAGFSLDVTSGDAGTATVTVTAEADNAGDAAELGTIVFTSGEASKTVTVSQAAGGGSVDPTDDIFYESFGTPAKDGTYWPYANDNASNIKSGTGFVEGTTSYKGYNTSARIANSATSPNPPFSGEGHCWFPANKAIEQNYFEVDKLVLKGQKNLTVQFGVYGNTAAYEDGAIVLEVSGDGTTWTKLDFSVSAVEVNGAAVSPEWKLAKIDFTLANAIEYLYVKWSSAVGNTRVDDMRVYEGQGGQTVDLGEGGSSSVLSVSPENVSLGASKGATAQVTVTATAGWTATTTGSGFTIDKTGADGDATVTVTAAADNSGDAVELGTIVFKSGMETKTVTVSQEAAGETSDDILYENFGTPAKSGDYWPYVDQCTSYSKTGSGYVEGTTAYKGYNTSIRIANSASSPNPPFSGEGHCWFPAKKTAAQNYFEIDNLVLNGQKNLTIQFGLYGNTSAYADGDIALEVSGNGTDWTTLSMDVTAVEVNGTAVDPAWKQGKADFTLANAIDKLFVRWSSATTAGVRMDDVRIYEGQGGQSVDLGQGGTAATLEVSPLSLSLGNAAGATKTFEITTTAAWTATVSGSGFSLDKTSGTGNATVTVTASAANSETSVKELGSVVVAAEGVAESKTVKVSQAAGQSTGSGDENQIVVDITSADIATPALPTTTTGAGTNTYTIGGREYVISSNKYYFKDYETESYGIAPYTALYVQATGYIQLPAIAGKKLTKVVATAAGNMGSNVKISVGTTDGATVAGGESTTFAKPSVAFDLSGTQENTAYRINVEAKNAQFNKLELTYEDAGGSVATPQITAVDPASVSFEAAGGTQSIAVTVADQGDNALTAAGLSGLLGATVSGNTVTVKAEANTGEAVSQTLTISVAGGNSVEVPVSIAAGNTGGNDAPAAGTVLWGETWASYGANSTTFTSNKVIGDYDYAGQTLYNPDNNADYTVTYTADESNAVRATTSTGANMVDGHLWFNKSAAGTWTISAIKLYGATNLKLSHAQGTSGSAVEALYSIDGNEWNSLGTQNGPIAETSYTFSVPAGTESVQIRFAHPASNAKNTRADSFYLTVGE